MTPSPVSTKAATPAAALANARLDHLIASLCADPGVSDIHVEQDAPPRVRKNGRLTERPDLGSVSLGSILDLLTHKAKEVGSSVEELQKRIAIKGAVDLAFSHAGTRFRANVYHVRERRLSMAIRRFPHEVPALATLGLPPAYSLSLKQAKGLVLVTGATGSGKSTTLASTIAHLNETRDAHIVTIEDPIEFVIPSKRCLIHQRQVGRDAPDFSSSLRAAMRQDPDILLVGELRDQETVKTALDAANTGHLVFATLHTMSARQSVERVLSFFAPEERDFVTGALSQVLLCVLSQSLLRTADGQGRALAAELMVNTSAVKTAIKDQKINQIFNAMDTGSKDGHVLLNAALKQLVRNRVVSVDEALYFSYDSVQLQRELGMGSGVAR